MRLPVYLGEIPPEAVRVELYADTSNGEGPMRHEMQRDRQLVGSMNGYVYKAQIPAMHPAADYTPHIIPQHPDVAVPLEAPHILWHR